MTSRTSRVCGSSKTSLIRASESARSGERAFGVIQSVAVISVMCPSCAMSIEKCPRRAPLPVRCRPLLSQSRTQSPPDAVGSTSSATGRDGRSIGPCRGSGKEIGLTCPPVLLLLPPSEVKTPGGSGPALGPRPQLSTPTLAPPRAELITALRRAARLDRGELAAGLNLPDGLASAALAANRAVTTAPTMAALDRYAGVLYAALDVAGLSTVARRRAEAQVVVFSGLWGVVRGGDALPDYRVPASGTVPGLGGVSAHWRGPLAAVLPLLVGDLPVLDMRSGDYRSMWRPAAALADQVVSVRVLAERGTGARRTTGPVSFHAKSVKGLVVRHLVTARRVHRDPMTALSEAAGALGLRLVNTSSGSARSVDLVGPFTPLASGRRP